jgi:hypothetical protein
MRAHVVDSENVGMIEGAGPSGFLLEPPQPVLIVAEVGGQDLDRNLAAQPRVLRPINFTHAARPNTGQDFIRAELRSRGKGHPFAQLYPSQQLVTDAADSERIV